MNNEWETPKEIFVPLDNEFFFDVDVAANETNTKCYDSYFGNNSPFKEYDALAVKNWSDYGTIFWMNPPFQEPWQSYFLEKALRESKKSPFIEIVCLIPATPETKRWQQFVSKAREIRFYTPRVNFYDRSLQRIIKGVRFPSAIAIFQGRRKSSPKVSWVDHIRLADEHELEIADNEDYYNVE